MSLERYELFAELGRGGFGTVYKARQLTTGQSVAVKVLHGLRGLDEAAQKRHLARFQWEMSLCAQLHHPHIVRLIDSGVLDDGRVYTAFEYVPGQTLARLLAEGGALDALEARHLMLQTLDALSCAHSVGVVHRDFKPHNIMVLATGARRNALVLDFGLAALVEGSDLLERDALLSGSREILGTPAYSAPEQLRGEAPTPSSDLFSWALVFLECLTGERPVRGQTLQEIIFQQLGPEPISMPHALRAHPLGRILARLLTKDVGARQVRTDKLLREIEQCDLSDLQLPVRARGRGTGARVQEGPPVDPGDMPTRTVVRLSEPASADQPVSSRDGERRQVTALCCLLLPADPPASSGGDTDAQEERDEHIQLGHQLCLEIGRSYSGVLGGSLGDKVLLYFGLGAESALHAQNAAYAVLELCRELQRRATLSDPRQRLRLELRASLHSGAIAAHRTGVMSSVSRVAGQLCDRAPPGGVLVSGTTAALLERGFDLEPDPDLSTSSERAFSLRSARSLPPELLTPRTRARRGG
jgi:serine/threonine protein kinase